MLLIRKKEKNYQISFMPDRDEQELLNGNIKTIIKTTISSQEPVEIRRVIFLKIKEIRKKY